MSIEEGMEEIIRLARRLEVKNAEIRTIISGPYPVSAKEHRGFGLYAAFSIITSALEQAEQDADIIRERLGGM
jgi:hypothetical protein